MGTQTGDYTRNVPNELHQHTLTHTHSQKEHFIFNFFSFLFFLFFFEEVAQIFTGEKRMLINDGNFVRVTLAKLIARREKEVQAEVRVNCECTRYICHLVLSLLWLLLALSKSSAIKWYVKAVRRQTSHRQTDDRANKSNSFLGVTSHALHVGVVHISTFVGF